MIGFLFVVETDPEFTNRLKEDRKYLAKGTNRRPLSRNRYSFPRYMNHLLL